MESNDDDLRNFGAHDAAPLPGPSDQGYVEHDGARFWYATYGSGSPVILLHGASAKSARAGAQLHQPLSLRGRSIPPTPACLSGGAGALLSPATPLASSPMAQLALHHVSIIVTDLPRSLAFYQNLFGLAIMERPPFKGAGAWLACGAVQVHLILHPAGSFRTPSTTTIGTSLSAPTISGAPSPR